MHEPDDDEPRSPWWVRLTSLAAQLGGILLVLAVVGRFRAPEPPPSPPPLVLHDVDGAAIDLAAFAGKPILLNFWATWCMPCRVEMPALKLWSSLHPGVAVVAVSVDQDAAALRRALPGMALPWPVAHDDGSLSRAWGVTTLPTTILLNPDGSLRAAHTGIGLGPEWELMLRGL